MTAAANGLTPWFGLATGLTIYSGTAQVTAIELVGDGAAAGVVVASVLCAVLVAFIARYLLGSISGFPQWVLDLEPFTLGAEVPRRGDGFHGHDVTVAPVGFGP